MPDADTDWLVPASKILPMVCGIIGLALGLVWGLWPSSIDPLSMGLSRTALFSRHLISSPVRPVIIDISPMRLANDTATEKGSASPWPILLEKIVAQDPRMIAFADVHHTLAPILGELDIVAPDPRLTTIFIPAAEINPSLSFFPWETAANQAIGLQSATAELRFNIYPVGERAPVAQSAGPPIPVRTAFPRGAYPIPAFALELASRLASGDVNGGDALPDSRKGLAANSSVKASRKTRIAIQGGHRLFFDSYSAAAVLEERIPQGVLRDRIILLGLRSAVRTPVGAASQSLLTRTETTAFGLWALLNKQIAYRPLGLFVFELGLVLGISICPAIFRRRFSLKATWMANGVLALVLLAGPILIWHLSGIMLQVGVAVLGVMLTGGVVSALAATRPSALSPAALGNASPPGRRNPLGPGVKSGAAAEDDSLESPSPPASASAVDTQPSPPSSMDTLPRRPGTVNKIGRYEILRCLGKGAMGEVFLGRDPHINRLTAIKTLHFEENFVEDEIEDIKEKFFREAESAGTLSHANIVTIYDAGEDRDLAYIAMEYLEGITLLRFTRPKRLLPVRKIIAYGVQIAQALDYAHRQGIVHRDIKPANIIVLKNGDIKITDFGIARITASSHTQTGVVKGTPYYMSPEQFSGAKVDGRSDIFSLGTMLFQLLTGTLPFFSESPAVLMNQIMNFPHPNPQAINSRVMPAIIPIVDRALEKNRERRYPQAGLMAADLIKLDRRIERHLQKKKRG